jgi:16S rRNA (cytidine1402-2'-O)-methyltransferase
VVATPLGNLADITLRALDILRGADLVAAEDTRTTSNLLAHHGIKARLLALHEHNEGRAADKLIEALAAGQSVALVSDAGTPAISDPGALAVARVLEAGFRVTPIPGPNAAITALSAAGMAETAFLFYGFLPAKAGARRKALEGLRGLPHALVFYEAPHRIAECIDDLAAGFEPARTVVFARELTKLFESIHRCRLDEAQAWLAADDNHRRGEFVLIVSGAPQVDGALDAEAERVLALVAADLPPAKAAKLAAAITGVPRDVLYAHALAKSGGAKPG